MLHNNSCKGAAVLYPGVIFVYVYVTDCNYDDLKNDYHLQSVIQRERMMHNVPCWYCTGLHGNEWHLHKHTSFSRFFQLRNCRPFSPYWRIENNDIRCACINCITSAWLWLLSRIRIRLLHKYTVCCDFNISVLSFVALSHENGKCIIQQLLNVHNTTM